MALLRTSKPAVHRSAVIDIGSNSVRLVVYEGPARAPAVIFNEKVAAGLGRGLATDGRIAAADAERGLTALRRYALLARHMEVKDLVCVATAAVRDAENGPDFIAAAAEAGLKIRLLSGEEEAEAAGYGVLSAIPEAHGIAVDLGGGSLELAEVAHGEVGRRASFPLGVLRLPALRRDGQQAFERAVRKMLRAAGWPGGMAGLPLYLVGGSWRALSRLDLELTNDPLAVLDQHSFPRTALRRLVRATRRLSFEELRAIPGMASNRAATLPDAAALLAALVALLTIAPLLWMLSVSFMARGEARNSPRRCFPAIRRSTIIAPCSAPSASGASCSTACSSRRSRRCSRSSSPSPRAMPSPSCASGAATQPSACSSPRLSCRARSGCCPFSSSSRRWGW